ncbi:MAG: rod shape-determining protein RodA [Anaerolineae bacterium]|nr:rod shape-determining protein RodA [Anaerolineae bacterium]
MVVSSWRRFDWPLFAATVILMLIGGAMIYSAYEINVESPGSGLLDNLVFRQGLFGVVGLILYFAAAAIDYHRLLSLSRWIYLFIVFILGITLLVGRIAFGAQSWIELRQFAPQPSEFAKVLMVFVLARQLSSDQVDLERPWPLLRSMLMSVPPVLLIYLQPDFGTALILLTTWLGLVFLSGVRWRHLAILALVAAVLAPVLWFQLEGYMRERFVTFLFPDQDPSGASYNVNQALISIGSGGWWGKGPLRGPQTQLYFLRVRHTDFIFSVLAEEMGFLGSLLLIALFAFVILRLVRVAWSARDSYGRLVAGGVAIMILVQTLINLGMNANLMPVTGLPLPLVSYGGSSLITTLLALGTAQSVAARQQVGERALV